ncbi:MAG: hypothetical protein CMJ29_06080 [Phycisphaerae bacterium]|nr:hypothetical protein [Phycisphaerae bacterium]
MMDDSHDALTLETDEVVRVLSHYDIGEPRSIRGYFRGSSKSPKALIESDAGKYILKRRGPGRDDPRRIVYEHAVHDHLSSQGYPVVEIIHSRRSRSKVVRSRDGIYELFRYVKAARCDGDSSSLVACGEALASFHEHLMTFDQPSPDVRGFHSVPDVPVHMERFAEKQKSRHRRACLFIRDAYVQSSRKVDQMGWASWPQTVVHGDWHPGNVLFGSEGEVVVVLDFDAVKWETRMSDLSSAILHFGRYVSALRCEDGRTWPVNIDIHAASALLKGYMSRSSRRPAAMELASIPSLVIEALVLETMPSLMREGRFGDMDTPEMLEHVVSSIERIRSESGRLISALGAIVG